ncbi:hypothetical protein F511_43468 [Dorcoceras hygrometricum]|uniref:Uncharacterized protein n=1 Tax=Dorcoceras hygrometricum TaxID=472368 RepID=A0A2Z7C0E7_9LAMI|nr:hypothetical protein F511_43468 [Dorcoceras hygrometricum]
MMRRRFVVATGSPAASFYQSLRDFSQGCEGERKYRTLILPAGIVATMRRVVNYHSSWARQQQVELFDASGNPGSTAGRGFNPAGGAPGGGYSALFLSSIATVLLACPLVPFRHLIQPISKHTEIPLVD